MITSAPGKLVILGEYAVLEGFKAVSMAVNRRVYCERTKNNKITVSGLNSKQLNVFVKLNKAIITGPDKYKFKLAQQLFNTALAHKFKIPNGDYKLDSRELYRNKSKLGLGSSGALTVALAAQLFDQPQDKNKLFEFALVAHRAYSGNKGSGIDVATSCFGGIIEYELINSKPKINQINSSDILENNLLVIDTGKSQNTRDYLEKVKNLKIHNSDLYFKIFENLKDQAENLKNNLFKQDNFTNFQAALEQNNQALLKLEQTADIKIFSHEILDIINLSKQFGGSAKPSGAGGGDLVLAFIPKAQRTDFLTRLEQSSYSHIPASVDHNGVLIKPHE